MGGVISLIIDSIKNLFTYVIFPVSRILTYVILVVLMATFIGNISGILGFFIFMYIFYYYVKGIILIEPER